MNNNIVYRYTNVLNGKMYIGRTNQSLKSRAGKNGKGYKTCLRFWNAICKYGWQNFKPEILADNLSFEQSVELEKYYIKKYKTYDDEHGYNILQQEPGNGSMPEETKERMRQARFDINAGIRKKREKRVQKYIRTEEHCLHLSESLKGNTPWNKGVKTGPLSQETKEKMSAIRKNNENSIHVAVRNITTGEIFRSGAAAGRSIGCTSEAIFASIKECRPCKGFYFERIYE